VSDTPLSLGIVVGSVRGGERLAKTRREWYELADPGVLPPLVVDPVIFDCGVEPPLNVDGELVAAARPLCRCGC